MPAQLHDVLTEAREHGTSGPPAFPVFVLMPHTHTEGKSNVRRTRAYARNVIRRLKVVWPGLESAVDDSKAEGLLIGRSVEPGACRQAR